MQPDLSLARRFLDAHPPHGRVLLCAITGSHLYGFPSVDSDLDIKGIHAAPTASLLGLKRPVDSHDRLEVFEGVECDLTTHELGKVLAQLLKGNGNMLERIASPYQIVDGPDVEALRALVPHTLSRRCHGHYAGYLKGMLREHVKVRRAKTLLYAYRVVLTGRFLLETGKVEAHLPTLAAHYGLTHLDELLARKRSAEKVSMPQAETAAHLPEILALREALDRARESSPLPDSPPGEAIVEDWLVQHRLAGIVES
ncbi:MAG: nucleotidyltransferase domain-containing protein [Alphaproteobacteria bacterium]|nr:nucleotidyltransferase domain-containing protein [Alphaproteobacteria bacterium]